MSGIFCRFEGRFRKALDLPRRGNALVLSAILQIPAPRFGSPPNPLPNASAIAIRLRLCIAVTVAALGMLVPFQTGLAQESFSGPDLEFFESRVRPLLVDHCHECHTGDEPSASLRLDSRAGVLRGGDSGAAAVPGEPQASLLIRAVHYSGPIQMPPDSKLPDPLIATLEEWVQRGLPWPPESKPAEGGGMAQPGTGAAAGGAEEWQRRLQHWAWKAPVQVTVPEAPGDWCRNEIDRFLWQGMESAGLKPAADADRAAVLRRAGFALHGILPTAEEIRRFESDAEPDALAREIDRLLASPRFGERFARHWMDLVRYAETCGHEFDYPLPHAWQYRDWMIRAFNLDLPYDSFVREQIAGDLVSPPRLHPEQLYDESIIGTGFWFMGEATHGPVDPKLDEAGRIDNQIDVMSKTFLGMTVACARCHDHKFDAISDEDYYALSGMLQSSRRQLALLDPGQRIGNTRRLAEQKWQAVDGQFQSAVRRLDPGQRDRFLRTLGAAVRLSNSRPTAGVSTERIQGEDLSAASPPVGHLEKQSIPARENFAWENDTQLWWRDGDEGAELNLPISIRAAGQVEVWVNLTEAPDYGICSFSIDGHSLRESVDCYAASLKTTGPVSLGQMTLQPGEHRLTIRLGGTNPSAIPRRMVGLDWIEFRTAEPSSVLEKWDSEVAAAAAELHFTVEQLKAVVESVPEVLADAAVLSDPVTDAPPRAPEHVLFHDFASGLEGWFPTGWAFDSPGDSFSIQADGSVSPAGVVTCGRYGGKFQGVLRSPTFEITHPEIRLLVRGGDLQVRVIIDGFVLDTYNPLLFEGLTRTIEPSAGFRWFTVSGDLKNHLGRRAHLELIDHGDGAGEIAEIWFGNGGDPFPLASSPIAVSPKGAPDSELNGIFEKLFDCVVEFPAVPGDGVRDRAQPEVAENRESEKSDSGSTAGSIRWRIHRARFTEWLTMGPGAAILPGSGKELAEVRAGLDQLKALVDPLPAPIPVQAIVEGTPEDEYLFIRGSHRNPGPVQPRRSLAALDGIGGIDWSRVSGSGRAALASELVHPSNPLVARVMVNRVWQYMFGRGLVATPDNFGLMGSPPSHPELLDWLAQDFVADGWSVKRLIRRIAASRAWQLSATASAEALAADPENRWYTRSDPRRMDGESIRDSILSISGELDDSLFGPPVPVHLTEFMQGRGRPGKSGPLDGNRRRTVYLEVRRNFLHPMMLAFDTPIPFNTMGRRNDSNVPAQSLILMNDPFVVDQAGKWAKKLLADFPDDATRIDEAWLATTGHLPTAAQRDECLALLGELEASASGPRLESVGLADPAGELRAWSALCHVLWNAKSFVFVW